MVHIQSDKINMIINVIIRTSIRKKFEYGYHLIPHIYINLMKNIFRSSFKPDGHQLDDIASHCDFDALCSIFSEFLFLIYRQTT